MTGPDGAAVAAPARDSVYGDWHRVHQFAAFTAGSDGTYRVRCTGGSAWVGQDASSLGFQLGSGIAASIRDASFAYLGLGVALLGLIPGIIGLVLLIRLRRRPADTPTSFGAG